jgi:hypothetical protein
MARFILLTALTLASAAVHFDTSHAAFEKFMQTHGRNYAGAEKEQRFLYFQENAAQVAAVARATPLAKFKLDGFTDWSPKEIKRQRPSNPMSTVYKNAEVQEQFSDELVHAAYANGPIDWVAKGAVTPAISQGRCGTCAQFSAVGDIEAQWFLAGHPLVALAVQGESPSSLPRAFQQYTPLFLQRHLLTLFPALPCNPSLLSLFLPGLQR